MVKRMSMAAVVMALVTAFAGTNLRTIAAQSSAASGANVLTARETADGWSLLFDGRTLTGWTPSGDADWKVEDGTITFTKGAGLLTNANAFGNFELKVDFYPESNTNSGVYLRCPADARASSRVCYEVNIFDQHETDPTGSIVGVHSTLPERAQTSGKWNTFEMTANGTHLVITLNGKSMTDITEDKFKFLKGAVVLQAGGPGGPGPVRFRNLKIRPI
jgi:hypothetical protein